MPNPIPALMPASGGAMKPAAAAKDASNTKGAESFQTVMDQEADAQPNEQKTAEPAIQNPDLAPDSEIIVVDSEVAPLPIEPQDQPPAEIRPAAVEIAQIPVVARQNEKPIVVAPVVIVEAEASANTQPVVAQSETVRSQPRPTQAEVAPTVQALIFASVPPKKTPQVVARPNGVPVGLATPDAHLDGTPDLPTPPRSEKETPATQTVPQTSRPEAVKPGRTPPTPVQIQLFAADTQSLQPEANPTTEIEDIPLSREATTLSSSRDSTPMTQTTTTATARAETARAVANQMATVVSARGQPGTIEVALNPEELGRVSIVLNGREDGLHMTISAERPETLDMMRRHLSVLETEFQNFGFGNLSFDLGTSAGSQHSDSDTGEGAGFSDTQPEQITEAAPAAPKLGPVGRIDMRL